MSYVWVLGVVISMFAGLKAMFVGLIPLAVGQQLLLRSHEATWDSNLHKDSTSCILNLNSTLMTGLDPSGLTKLWEDRICLTSVLAVSCSTLCLANPRCQPSIQLVRCRAGRVEIVVFVGVRYHDWFNWKAPVS